MRSYNLFTIWTSRSDTWLSGEFFKSNLLRHFQLFLRYSLIPAWIGGFVILILYYLFADPLNDKNAAEFYFPFTRFFLKYIYGMLVLVTAAQWIANEFDQRTILHLFLKGIEPRQLIIRKWLVLFTKSLSGLFIFLLVQMGMYLYYASFNAERVLLADFINYAISITTMVSLGLVLGTIAQKASRAVTFCILYFFVFENLFGYLLGAVLRFMEMHAAAGLLDWTPLSLLARLESARFGGVDYGIFFLVILVYNIGALGFAADFLRTRELGRIK